MNKTLRTEQDLRLPDISPSLMCDPRPGRMTVILTITPQDANLQYEPSRGRKKEILISNGLEVVAVAGDFYVNKVMK